MATEFTKENELLILERLIESGFEIAEADTIHKEVKEQMYVCDFETKLRDWYSLSLFFILVAKRKKYTKAEFRQFYE
ncbi:hypothetical protein [uncultured Maribacter sp.]|uniref:hypothetical protein n=1 Tax=uncultured Maribacter sp. TaxID=431308 RepID=UPI0030DC46CC